MPGGLLSGDLATVGVLFAPEVGPLAAVIGGSAGEPAREQSQRRHTAPVFTIREETVTSSWEGPSTASLPSEPPTAPVTGPPASMQHDPSTPERSRVALSVYLVGILLLGLGFTAWQWSDASDRADRLQRQVDEFEAAEAERRAEEDSRPDLIQIARAIDVDDDGVVFHGDSTSLDVNIAYAYGDALDWFETLLEELGFPNAVRSRIGHTRALDGTQEAAADHVRITWTYHPDDGLSAVFSVED
jgi:hypothetical protein